MATLFDRLFTDSVDYEKVPVHYFFSALVDFASGNSTKAQIVSAFGLDAQSEAQLDTLISGYQNATDKTRWLEELHAVMMLSEGKYKYTTVQDFAARMGL